MGILDRILGRRSRGEPTSLERSDDPRGGTQGDEYRHADPRDVVGEGGVAMSGPGGAPQEDLSSDRRRELDRETD